MIKNINPHRGQTFDDYLKETGRYEEVSALAQKKLVALRAKEARKRKLLAARKKPAKKRKSPALSAAIKSFINKRSGDAVASKSTPAPRYAKRRSPRTSKKI